MATDDENDDTEREDDSLEDPSSDDEGDDSLDEGDDESRAEEDGDESRAAADEADDESDSESDAQSDDADADEADEPAPARQVAARSASDDDEGEPADDFDARLPPVTSLLGVERWVQFAFIALGVVVFFVADEIINLVWGGLGYTPDGTIASGSAALLGIITAFLLYRDARVNDMAHEVASELSKVTWPSREETYYSTIIVLVTSVVAALYTGVFDALWSAFTDLIYNVRA